MTENLEQNEKGLMERGEEVRRSEELERLQQEVEKRQEKVEIPASIGYHYCTTSFK